MAHTRSTTNYNLPQFDNTDKPTWLGDINGAFLAIDTAMHDNAGDATEAKQAATSALAALNNALERATAADTKAGQALTAATSASETATAAAATAANAQTAATAATNGLAAARFKSVWSVSDPTATQAPGTETISNMTAAGKLFLLVFNDGTGSAKTSVSAFVEGACTVKASIVENDTISGSVDQFYREVSFAQSTDDITVTIGACNKLSNSAGTVTPSVDNTRLILTGIYASELPA